MRACAMRPLSLPLLLGSPPPLQQLAHVQMSTASTAAQLQPINTALLQATWERRESARSKPEGARAPQFIGTEGGGGLLFLRLVLDAAAVVVVVVFLPTVDRLPLVCSLRKHSSKTNGTLLGQQRLERRKQRTTTTTTTTERLFAARARLSR